MVQFFGPDIGRSRPSLTYQLSVYPAEEVTGQSADLRLTQHNASFSLPLAQNPQNEWTFTTTLRGEQINTSAILPDTQEAFPESLWDLRFGPRYRHRFENGWIGGGSLSVGSASDKLFHSMDETELQVTLFTRIPRGERNAWFALLTYSNNREILNGIPIPGVGYWYEPSPRYRVIIGIPFAFIQMKPIRDVSIELSYLPVRFVHAKASYHLLRSLLFYVGFDWRNESYFRADRPDKEDRLFYYEKQVGAGLRWEIYKHAFGELGAGYGFDRFYFEGEKYDDRDKNRLAVENGPFLSVRVGFRF
jgi:hypothetical protein